MKTLDITKNGPRYWSRTGRPVRPYLIDPITITDEALSEQVPPPDADPDEGQRFLLDPIHPHLLALTPGDPESLAVFTTQLGLQEFFDWIGPKGFPVHHPITRLMERYESGYRHFSLEMLADAWMDPVVSKTVAQEQQLLRAAFEAAQIDDADEAALHVLDLGWERNVFLIDLDIDRTDQIVYERPTHIWSRAWFELLEGVHGGRRPRPCEYCGEPFIPRRKNAAYCVGTKCQQRAYDRRRAKTERRKNYQKEHKRKERSEQRTGRETGPETKGDDDGIN
jgi:hypothetical protein